MSTAGGSQSASDPVAAAAQLMAQLKRRRATIKAACTRSEGYVNGVTRVSETTRIQLRERRKKLDVYWDEYSSIQTRIEDLDESETRDRETFENAYYDLCTKIAELCEPIVTASPAPSVSESNGAGCASAHNNVRLPKLNLPLFNGKYEECVPFRNLFTTAVHNNGSLAKVEKLQYVRGTLSGEALDIIKALEVSDMNYDAAWNLLGERYNNERAIAYAHIKEIMYFPQLTKENAIDIRKMHDSVSRHLLSLKALKREADKWDNILVY
ncbi:uncharacterized protein [Cardiocondyla obscurior]|uniref:uncharacterized protein n=1 Tax=Cardiocondyla obscurior TaxID=286306 RepID=UPI0039657053